MRDEFRQRVAERMVANWVSGAAEPSAGGEPGLAASPAPAPATSALEDFPDPTWIGLAWVLGAGLLVLRVFTARLLSTLFRFRSRPVRDSRLIATAGLLAQRLGLRSTLV